MKGSEPHKAGRHRRHGRRTLQRTNRRPSSQPFDKKILHIVALLLLAILRGFAKRAQGRAYAPASFPLFAR